MQILTLSYYFLRSVLLRGIVGTANLLYGEIKHEKKFRIKTSTFKRSDSKLFFHYQGAGYVILFRIFEEIKKYIPGHAFVDIGSGRGRVAFVAERYGFTDITGVELDQELVLCANENLKLVSLKSKDSRIVFVQSNALDFKFEDKPTVFFMFNPFNSEVLEKVLQRIENQTSCENLLIYMNPLFENVFQRKGVKELKRVRTGFYTEAIIYSMRRDQASS